MSKSSEDTPEYERHHGMVLESIEEKFQIVVEVTQDIPAMKKQIAKMAEWEDSVNMIPAMQKQIAKMAKWEDSVNMIPAMQEQIGKMAKWEDSVNMIPAMQKRIDGMSKWEDRINMIPAIFEEVGKLREEVDELNRGMKVLGMYSHRLESLDKRLKVVEQQVK